MKSKVDELQEIERLLGLCEVQSTRSGVPLPLGAHRRGDGVNFALFSRNASGVRLDLFEHEADAVPSRTIILDPERNKTGDIWHVWLANVPVGQLYGFRLTGPYAPAEGHRFNPNKLLIDPYAAALSPARDLTAALGYDPDSRELDLSFSETDDAGQVPKSAVVFDDFNWQGDQPLRRPWASTVIYELHVRGYTIHPSSRVRFPGTFRGLTEKIGHLKELGVTAVELMPVIETGQSTAVNYWGYDPINFFALRSAYAGASEKGGPLLELKEMVRLLHREGLEVILDVVFNHTREGNELGPTLCFRGVDNAVYYYLKDDKRYYRDYTGVGQTVNAAHPFVRDLVLDALRYWVIEAHVDGFRFDLASVLGRDAHGGLLADAPLLERIAEDPILRDTKLIAEAWDAAGAYQVGSFSQRRWSEWNGHFRDDVRRFWRGDLGMLGRFASRLAGSSDIYGASGKGPEASINFITCHDGFTLRDLVSYERKHNEPNGHGNRDGADDNQSANYGVEGETDDPVIVELRARQQRNLLLTLAVSRGVPMLLAGDELGRTQRGNNNPYCQDNETSWLDWSLLEQNAELFRFARDMLAFRRAHAVLRRDAFYSQRAAHWFAPGGGTPDWFDPGARALALLAEADDGPALLLTFNAGAESQHFVLPPLSPERSWHVAVDTGRRPFVWEQPAIVSGTSAYTVLARSSAILLALG
ncbi:MAG TPA: glycogen debranching protein GlgX [Polyangiaceae bacterium]|nr:glycogen debranching protein GlgX [Polyangiaceae bacterium]